MALYVWIPFVLSTYFAGSSSKYQGPSFVHEPPGKVTFYNTSGAVISCVAAGTPRPEVSWWTASDQSPVVPSGTVRQVRPDGSLAFSPFAKEDYRNDMHSAVYRCSARNSVGGIVSRDVHVRGVVYEPFEVHVHDEFTIRGNAGVLRCTVPSQVRDHVKVVSWKRDDGLVILQQQRSSPETDRYVVYPSGELHIKVVEYSDSHFLFKCQVRDLLTRQTKESISGGRFIITDPQSNVPPSLIHVVRHVTARQGDVALLPCVSQGHPAPTYRWSRRSSGQMFDISGDGDRHHLVNGFLFLSHAVQQDAGTYVCVAKNEAGEARAEIQLTVRAPDTPRAHS